MDMSAVAFSTGAVKSMSGGNKKDFSSHIAIVLPEKFSAIPTGEYLVDSEYGVVKVKFATIESEEHDPVYYPVREMNLGAGGSGLDTIPIQAFTDNRGEYPATIAEITFDERIASWVDDSQPSGMKIIDYERAKITGTPINEEKVKSILVLNKVINSLGVEGLKSLTYDDFSCFSEAYKGRHKGVLFRTIHAVTSKDAYKNAIYDYILPTQERGEVTEAVNDFYNTFLNKDIETESDLKSTVENAIISVLKLNIEKRRWIEPFWDGQRIIKSDGEEDLIIPREPKGEVKIQPTLHVILDMALSPLGIQVIRESDEGIGSLDFRFLFTTAKRIPLTVGIEFKVAHHQQVKKGITKQLPAYLEAIRSRSGIFVIMWFKDDEFFKKPRARELGSMTEWLVNEAITVSENKNMDISSIVLDASIKPSASNL